MSLFTELYFLHDTRLWEFNLINLKSILSITFNDHPKIYFK